MIRKISSVMYKIHVEHNRALRTIMIPSEKLRREVGFLFLPFRVFLVTAPA